MNSTETDNGRNRSENLEKITSYINHLEKKIKDIELEKNIVRSELSRLEHEVKSLRLEIDRLCEPPLLTGQITDVLDDKLERVIIRCTTNASYIVKVSHKIQKEKIIPGSNIALNQRNYTVMEILPKEVDPFIKGMEVIDTLIDVSYDDIGGLNEQIQEVREVVELPLKKPELFERIGIDPPRGVLFHGYPGTGKTLLAKAVAHEANATFIKVIGSELVQKFIGEGAQYVRDIFNLARQKAPSILFIDELDAIGAVRMEDATSGDREVNRTLMQLLSELDGFDQRGDVKFIAATNRYDILDSALLRPGRFDRIIEFPLPNEEARESIFEIHMKKLNLEQNIKIEVLVSLTEGATGSDIKGICTEAGMYAIRRNSDIISTDDFLKAVNKIMKRKDKDLCPPELFL